MTDGPPERGDDHDPDAHHSATATPPAGVDRRCDVGNPHDGNGFDGRGRRRRDTGEVFQERERPVRGSSIERRLVDDLGDDVVAGATGCQVGQRHQRERSHERVDVDALHG